MGLVDNRSAEMGCRIRNVAAMHIRMFVMGTAPPARLSDWAGFLFGVYSPSDASLPCISGCL